MSPKEVIAQPDAAPPMAPNDSSTRLVGAGAFSILALSLAACGGSGSGASSLNDPSQGGMPESKSGPASSTTSLKAAPLPAAMQPTVVDTARFLAQASFGATGQAEINAVQQAGFEAWLNHQLSLGTFSHLDYLEARRQVRQVELNSKVMSEPGGSAEQPVMAGGAPEMAYLSDEWSYEAIWQQWLYDPGQLRARMAFALSQIMVISNIAPDIPPLAMSSYMDMLNRNAFANYRGLLEQVTLHPAMGYYLNMLESEKEDPEEGTHPNENYAREVLQLFSIGLVKLNIDGSPQRDSGGRTIPTYDQAVVQGFAKAFSGWSFGGRNTTRADMFGHGEDNWIVPMQAWPSKHDTGVKVLLDGRSLPAGQSAQKDMADALDVIFNHPNVGPFIGRRLIQRFVTSNPSPSYIARVATTFNNNGQGVRGDLAAVIRAVLLDPEARDMATAQSASFGKQREPVIRFANMLRALGATSKSGRNAIHYLDSADNAIGQSPLLSPSVFNFFSPDFRNPGAIATAGLVSPEFQITTETTVVGGLNFFARLVNEHGYGWDESRVELNYKPLEAMAGSSGALVDWVNLMFANSMMSATSRASILKAINAIAPTNPTQRVKAALVLSAISPDFVVQH
jgi:uncharacterized protein (DUF1800 family)